MIIYNVTTQVSHAIAESWLEWLKGEHIPDLISTGCFNNARILRLVEVDETDGPTYAIQYESADLESYNRYISEFSEEMRKKATSRWGDQFIAFRSVLRVVN